MLKYEPNVYFSSGEPDITMEGKSDFRKCFGMGNRSDLNFRTLFAFKTVFSKCSYSYRCCPCAFEHEFFLYIGEDGRVVDDEIYRRIERSIADGRCSHVRHVDDESLRETSVFGAHVAAILGSDHAAHQLVSGIFELSPNDIACVKQKYMKAKTYQILYSHAFHGQIYDVFSTFEKLLCHKFDKNGNQMIAVSTISYSKLFFHPRDSAKLDHILSCLLYKQEHIEQTICHALKNNLTDLQGTLVEHIRIRAEQTERTRIICYFIRSAILYDCPEILRIVIEKELKDNAHTRTINARTEFAPENFQTLSIICEILNRHACKEVFATHGFAHDGNVSVTYRISELFHLLKIFYSDFKDELVATLKQVPKIEEKSGTYLDRNIDFVAEATQVVSEILALGADIDGINNLFSRILQHFNLNNRKVRETAKVLLSANPDLSQQQGVVELALSQDELLYKKERAATHTTALINTYNCDAKEHGQFGYNGNDLALNFAAPFLLECGFPVSRIALEDAVFKNLHPAEIKYIQAYLDSPKPLVLACRNTLRNNFRGKKLWEFLKTTRCPQKIQDIILMKSLLQPQ